MAAPSVQIEKLHRLLDVTRHMAATTNLDQLLGTIVDATRAVLECERATIFLYDAARAELLSRVATGAEGIRFPADRGIAGAAAQQRRVVNVPDAYADERFNQDVDRRTGFRTRNLLACPLENLAGELMGVLQALNKRDGPFSPADEDLARVLSAQAGVALHRYALLEQYAEKQRMARDLELARRIQQQLFPHSNPTAAGYEIAGWNQCAEETGGDCYDFICLENGRQAILLADATGHGIGAALIIAQCRSLTRAILTVTDDIRTLANRVNRLLAADLMDDRFVTAFIGVLDTQRHRLEYVAAGQGPLLLLGPDRTDVRSATGLPFGIIADAEYNPECFDFAPGSTVVLLTDGFYETTGHGAEHYGDTRVVNFIRAHPQLPLSDLIQALHDDIREFSGDAVQADDLTAVIVRRVK